MGPKTLLFGTAGIPSSTDPYNTIEGIKRAAALGLGAMELEFVRNVNVSKEKAPIVREVAEANNIVLTAHGSYYINLNSDDPAKTKASVQRIFQGARRLHECGGWSITFHPAFYMKRSSEETYARVKKELKGIVRRLQDEGNTVWIRPETTGKGTQFGSLQEILRLSQELEQVMPTIDFAHLHARSNGRWNTAEEFRRILRDVEKALGKEGLRNMHAHLSGIAYGEKGERNHLMLEDSDMNYKDLVKVWKEFRTRGVVICESPDPQEDILLLQKTYNHV